MSHRSRVLIIVSVAMILLGTYALVEDVRDLLDSDQGFRIVSSIAASASCVIAGFGGIFYHSKKRILGVGMLLLLVTTIDVIVGIVLFDMSLFHLTLFIWPILYLWGWHCSKEE